MNQHRKSITRVAIQGERGAFSEDAAHNLFPEGFELVPCVNFESLFAAVEASASDYAVAPIENTLAGSVLRCCDLLLESDLHIVGETIVPIRHCLIGCEGSSLQTIRTVASHPVALAQCKRFLAEHPQIRAVEANDTAGSVREMMEIADPMLGAIASAHAAHIYGGKILARDVEDHSENYTRFLLLGRESLSGDALQRTDKLSIAFVLTGRNGALHEVLSLLSRAGIEMVKIESRPIPGNPWQYRYFADLHAPATEQTTCTALQQLRNSSCVQGLRVLGIYPSAKSFQMKFKKEFAS